jgi:hypothetical protein
MGCHPSGLLFVVMFQANPQLTIKYQAKNVDIHSKELLKKLFRPTSDNGALQLEVILSFRSAGRTCYIVL